MVLEKIAPLVKSLLLPLVVVFLAVLTVSQGLLTEVSLPLAALMAAALLLIALGLSVTFKRSSFFFLLVILCLNFLFQLSYPKAPDTNPFLLLLLPINIFLCALIGERGILSHWGKIYFGLIAFQLLMTYWLIDTQYLTDLVGLQTHLSPLLSYPALQYLVNVVLVVLLSGGSIIADGRPYGPFIGLIAVVDLGSMLAENPMSWPVFSGAGAVIVILETIKYAYASLFRDELTRLYSRRCLNLDKMKLSGTYSIAMLDIDHFKKFNDTYGHDVGDQVLRYVASRIMRTSGGGKAYRYGGEEFAVIFPDKTKDEVVPYLEELRKSLKNFPFTLRSKDRPKKKPRHKSSRPRNHNKVAVTLSIGIADNVNKNITPDEVIKAADKALYRAKNSGRDRICT